MYGLSTPYLKCFLTATTSDVTAQLNSRERGGARTRKTQTYTTMVVQILSVIHREQLFFYIKEEPLNAKHWRLKYHMLAC